MSPNPGPSLDSVYVPGTPGADWTDEEIESTRYRILQAIHPDWAVKYEMFGENQQGRDGVSENKILRLVFHDCVKYTGIANIKKLIIFNDGNFFIKMAQEDVMDA